MKIFVITVSNLNKAEVYVTAKPSFEAAEAYARKIYPDMRKTIERRKGVTAYFTDGTKQFYIFIHEERMDA